MGVNPDPAPIGQPPDSPESLASLFPRSGANRIVMDLQPTTSGGGEESVADVDHLADVLGPLEQIVLGADEELGSIQERVEAAAGRDAERIQLDVREAALEQRKRVVQIKAELIDRATAMAACFDVVLNILDEAERDLATLAGLEGGGVRVKLTERQRVTFAHEDNTAGEQGVEPEHAGSDPFEAPQPAWVPSQPVPPAAEAASAPAAPPPEPASVPVAMSAPNTAPYQEKGIRRLLRRFRRSAA
jgi:hypothetical protein